MALEAVAFPAAEPSVFRRSSPLLATSFVNRCGTIGLSLLPMLLVDQRLSPRSAAAVMTVVKGSMLAGTFLGGFLCDSVGLRRTLLLSFLLTGLGMGILPFQTAVVGLTFFGVLAQLGDSMFPSAARLMLTGLVPASGQREAIGWLRGVGNLGQIVSFLIGWLMAGVGIAGLMVFDSATAFAAAAIGWRALGEREPRPPAREPSAPAWSASDGEQRRLLLMNTAVVAGFWFLYEFFMVSTAAKFRLLYAAEGLALFSKIMVANTVLCALLSVAASRRLTDPNRALPAGIVLAMLGCLLSLAPGASPSRVILGTFVLTLGEIVFMSLAGFITLRLLGGSSKQGTLYGFVLVVQVLGRILGSAAAFPYAVHGRHPEVLVAVAGAMSLAFCWLSRKGVARHA